MPQPRAFVLRQAENHRNNYTSELPAIDKKRATAVLVRQSKDGADTAHGESRETQLGLQDYGKLLYGDDEPLVKLYDEGAGVSGQKRIDQREELDRLYRDMHKGIIGQIVMAREDRLFRNKHMDQVGAFTKLAEEKRIKVIVPPISSVASNEKTRVYDFTNYNDLRAFQDKMREAYAYIEGHVKHMSFCKQNKADKGGYDGRALPPGLAVRGRKQNQEIVIYEPWANVIRKIALRAQALDWDLVKLKRELGKRAFLFPDIPDEDKERYIFKTNMYHIPGVGYKPRDPLSVRNWLTNLMYLGWWQPLADKPDIIVDHHAAILDYALFAEGYARITGYTLEGEPVATYRGVTRYPKKREEAPEALFYGKIITKPPTPDRTAFVTVVDDIHNGLSYNGRSLKPDGMMIESLFNIPVAPFDAVVVERLRNLATADIDIKDRIKQTLEQVHDQQSEDFVSIHEQLRVIDIQLAENAEKRLETSKKDPLYARLQEQAEDLMHIQEQLEAKKEKLGIMDRDSPEEIEQLHSLLGNFEAVWPTFDLDQKRRTFSLLINRIEVEVISPHWLRLSIDWLDALYPRVDVAYVWRVAGALGGSFTDEEKEILTEYYTDSPHQEILKMLPDRTWNSISRQAQAMNLQRARGVKNAIGRQVCYRDFVPALDGNYLFRDYETTLYYINLASGNTAKGRKQFYPIWILSQDVLDLRSVVGDDLNGIDQAIFSLPNVQDQEAFDILATKIVPVVEKIPVAGR